MNKPLQKLWMLLVLSMFAVGTAFAQVPVQPFHSVVTLDLNNNGKVDAVVLVNDGTQTRIEPTSVPNYNGFAVTKPDGSASYAFNTGINGGKPLIINFELANGVTAINSYLAGACAGTTPPAVCVGMTAASANFANYADALMGGPGVGPNSRPKAGALWTSNAATTCTFGTTSDPLLTSGNCVATSDLDDDVVLFVNELGGDGSTPPQVTYDSTTGQLTWGPVGGPFTPQQQIATFSVPEQDGVYTVLAEAPCTADLDNDGIIDAVKLTFTEPVTGSKHSFFSDQTPVNASHTGFITMDQATAGYPTLPTTSRYDARPSHGAPTGAFASNGTTALTTSTTASTNIFNQSATTMYVAVNEAFSRPWTGEDLFMGYLATASTSSNRLVDAGGLFLRPALASGTGAVWGPTGLQTTTGLEASFYVKDCVAPFIMSVETKDTLPAEGAAAQYGAPSFYDAGNLGGSNPQGNGQIDRLKVTYSEVMANAPISGMTLDMGYSFKGSPQAQPEVAVPGVVNTAGAAIKWTESSYVLNESGTPDTDALPYITYAQQTDAAKQVRDYRSNQLWQGANTAAVTSGSNTTFRTDDDASPAIVEIRAFDAINDDCANCDGYLSGLSFVWSEPLGNSYDKAPGATSPTNHLWSNRNNGVGDIVKLGAYEPANPEASATNSYAANTTPRVEINVDHTKTTATNDEVYTGNPSNSSGTSGKTGPVRVNIFFGGSDARKYFTDYKPNGYSQREGTNGIIDLVGQVPASNGQILGSTFANVANLINFPGYARVNYKTVDKAAPIAMAAGTDDRDGDGFLDGYYVIFSERVSEATFGCPSELPNPAFAVTGYSNVIMNCTHPKNVANDNIIWIKFDEKNLSAGTTPTGKDANQVFNYDTGVVPVLTSGATGAYCLTKELSEDNEVPAVANRAETGGHVTACLSGNTLKISGAFSNLTSAFTGAHLHMANGTKFSPDLNVTLAPGNTSGIINETSITLTDAQVTSYVAGAYYVNVHSANNPNGEIRANLTTINGRDMVGNAMCPVTTVIKDENSSVTGFQTSRLFDDAEPVLVSAIGQVTKNTIRLRFSEKLASFNPGAFGYTNTDAAGNGSLTGGTLDASEDRGILTTGAALTSADVTGDKITFAGTAASVIGVDKAGTCSTATLPDNCLYYTDPVGVSLDASGNQVAGLHQPNSPTDVFGTVATHQTSAVYPSTDGEYSASGDGVNPLVFKGCFDKLATANCPLSMGFDDTEAPFALASRTIDSNVNGKIDTILILMSEEVADGTVDASKITVAGYTVTGLATIPDSNNSGTITTADLRNWYFNTAVEPGGWSTLADMFEDQWIAVSVAEIAGSNGDTGATPKVTVAAGAVKDFKPNTSTAGELTPADCATPAIMSGAVIGPSTISVKFSEKILASSFNVDDVRFFNYNFPNLPLGGQVSDLKYGADGQSVSFFFTPHDIFNLNSTQKIGGLLADIDRIADLNGNWNLQHGNPARDTAPAKNWFANFDFGTMLGVAGAADGCSSVADVAGSNGSVIEATVCRSVNDRFHTGYVDGSTMVTRYEIYLVKEDNVDVPRVLVAQFQPPSNGLTTDQDKFKVRFPVLPASSKPRTYAVVAVGGADIITAGKADFNPINAAALEYGDNLKLDAAANKSGEFASPLVVIGSVASVEEAELAPAAVGKDLKFKDGTTGTNIIATLTKSADHDRVERQTYMGLLNIPATVEVPLVLGYNVYDKDNKLVASVSKSNVTTNADGTISFTFAAATAGAKASYTVKAFDGIQESAASNSADGTAIGGGAPGDADNNGCINVVDLSFFAASYSNTANYSTTFDFNNDGAVNLVDYVAFAKVFKGTCSVAGKNETLEASNGKLTVEIQGNLAIVRLNGTDAQGVQFDVMADGAKVAKVEDGSAFRGNSLSAYSEANGGFTYAVASTEGTVNGGVVAVINLDGKAKSVKLANIQIVEKSVAKLATDVTAMGIPSEFALGANYPNPFNPTTNINFSLPENVNVRLEVYDMTGRLVKSLVRGQLDAGVHTITWNGQDNAGTQVASGVYLYRLQAGTFVQTKTMTLLK